MGIQHICLRNCTYLIVCLLAYTTTIQAQGLPEDPILGPADRTLGAWQNPNVGFVFDMVVDASDIEGSEWTTQGFKIRSAELDVNANIDPYGSLHGNFNFSEDGAALHEGYFLLPALPGNLKLKGGHMLANFGHWNPFHTHAMPFASEPRIYMEYFGGHFSPTGLELSWLVPIPHYLELTVSVYDRIEGHTHDEDPVPEGYESEADRIAAELGYEKHGNHYHTPDGSIVWPEDLLDDDAPRTNAKSNKGADDLAYAARAATNFEFGPDWSLDVGASVVHQPNFKYSQRIEDKTFGKTVYGFDATFFWHPLTRNRERNLDFGIEYLGNIEEFETVENDTIFRDERVRDGFFAYFHYQHNPTWHYGLFGEIFENNQFSNDFDKKRYGGFITFYLTHFQFLRLEYSRYEYSDNLDPVNRVILQYDAVIGHHTHGRQR
jgi:hypothetical protein